MLSNERWLITGGLGFIGSNLIDHVMAKSQRLPWSGLKIRVLDNCVTSHMKEPSPYWSSDQVELIKGDIRDEEIVHHSMEGIDRVVHLAAHAGVLPSVQDPKYDFSVNAIGTFNVLNSARVHGVRSIVFASSGATVGTVSPPIQPRTPLQPLSPYGASKACGEVLIHAFRESYGMNVSALRFGNIFGPKSTLKGSVIPLFIRKSLLQETLEIFGDGDQKRDFLYVEDLCEAILSAVLCPRLKEPVYQLAQGRGISLNELIVALEVALRQFDLPMPEVIRRPARPAEILASFYDLTLTKRDLQWEARHTMVEGIVKTLQWYLLQDANPSV